MADSDRALENAEQIIKLTEEQAAQQEKIKGLLKGIDGLNKTQRAEREKDIKSAKLILTIKKKELKITQGLSDVQDELRDLTDKESALAFDMVAHKKKILKAAAEVRKLEKIGTVEAKEKVKELKKQTKFTKQLYDKNKDMVAKVQVQHQLTDKLLGTIGSSVSGMKGMVAQAELFSMALLKNPFVLMLAALVAVVKMLSMGVKQAFDFQDELGTSANQSIQLASKLTLVNSSLSVLGIDGTKIAGELANNLGGIGAVTKENVNYFGLMSKSLGVSSETGIQVFKAMESISSAGEAGAKATLEFTAALAESNNVAPGAIMNDIAANTEMFAEFGLDGGKNIAKAAVQARKLGLNLATTAKIANSLLDFESSIEKEMEASMLIGKQLNYNKARALALEGDLAGAAADVVKQIGGKAELEKMNVLQRRALADSIGVSVDELSKLAGGKMEVKDADKDIKKQQANMTKNLNKGIEGLQKVMSFLIKATLGLTAVTLLLTAARSMGMLKGFGKGGMLKSMKSGGTKLMGKAALGVAGKKALTKKGGGAIMKSTGKKVYGAAAKAAVTKGTAKIAGKTLAKSALKKIPGVGLIAGLGFGLSRLMKGDLAGAVGEIASGAASIIPGLGTAASLAIDAGLAARDISKANKDSAEVIGEQSTAIEQKVSAEEPDTMKKMAEHQVTDSETTKVYQEKSLIMLQQIIEANNQTGTKVEGLTKE
jgi:hypothetical protein